MSNNVTREDLDCLVAYLSSDEPRLTNGPVVTQFEDAWSQWLGVRHTVMVNSGSSANDVTMLCLRHLRGVGEVVVSPLAWVSDIASVLHAGHMPVFVDIDLATLAPAAERIAASITPRTRAVFLTHVLGLNALTPDHCRLFDALDKAELIEDVSESHGAMAGAHRAGTVGWISDFSFYYAHHLTTGEGGAVCTSDDEAYEALRMLRSHGLVREIRNDMVREERTRRYPDLNPEFIFEYPSHNMRPTELQGVLGLSQLSRLDANNEIRRRNFAQFLGALDNERFITEFALQGSCNYAFILLLREADRETRDRIEKSMYASGIEFRRGLSGGGNQLRQPYARRAFPDIRPEAFPNVEHVHSFGWYIGNYPGVDASDIEWLCEVLNTA